MATTKYIDALRVFNGDYTMYHNSEKLKTVLRYDEIVRGCVEVEEPYEERYFTLESLEDGNTITFTKSNGAPNNIVYYSTDNGTTWAGSSTTVSWNLDAGESVMLKATANKWSNDGGGRWVLSSTNKFNAYGNIMSIIYGDNFTSNYNMTSSNSYAFQSLFYNSKIVDASNLILAATTIADYCYQSMFNNCSLLTTSPKLPATALTPYCYYQMFYYCSSLVNVQEISATSMAWMSCAYMFEYCSSLVTAPALNATTLDGHCYLDMFAFCSSLVNAPVLPATTLAYNCYGQMFYYCTSLNYIKCLATDISAVDCTSAWVTNVAASGTFVKSASMNDWPTGDSGIPSGWTVQTV